MINDQPDKAEAPRPRSLIVDVASAHPEAPSGPKPNLKGPKLKTQTWVFFFAAGAVFVVGLCVMEIFNRSDPSGPGIGSCRDVDGAAAAIRTTVDAYARTETEALQFRQRHISREVSTTRGCRISVYGELRATWPDGTTTNEAFDANAMPARDGSRRWIVDGPFFYDQADDGVIQ